jgi:uncharacterized hydrophobic protein (TIGR00271 family)
MSRFGDVLHGGPVGAEEIARVREVVMFEEPGLQARLVRFWALLILASAIATFGLYADSVATVIGAMIVAPLMLPIMGLAFGISIGDTGAIGRSLLVSVGGIATAIGVGYALSFLMVGYHDVTTVNQIMIRTSPRLVDLLAALATGLAGAFAIGRKDVSDTLPGVAIAISLVPPLANAGILLGAGRTDLAVGSLILFATNYLAIVLTGSFVYGLMGFPRAALEGSSRRAKRVAIAVVIAMILFVTFPLGISSLKVILQSRIEQRATEATKTWLTGSDYRFVSVKVDEGRVNLVVSGSGLLPPQTALEAALKDRVYNLPVRVEAVPSTAIDLNL